MGSKRISLKAYANKLKNAEMNKFPERVTDFFKTENMNPPINKWTQ